ncbi:GNAT family N-acetyltransferase [candidate division KSB1 bacterium]|nr:GNAT family N-acetyltransferase [candidate division KSB1 bacterium]
MDYHSVIDPFFKRSDDGHINFQKYIESIIPNDDAFLGVAIEADRVVGYVLAQKTVYPPVFVNTDFCMINDIVLLPEFRNQGKGKMLFDAVVDWSRKKGLDRIQLQVLPENTPALRFYEKLGFKQHLLTLSINI